MIRTFHSTGCPGTEGIRSPRDAQRVVCAAKQQEAEIWLVPDWEERVV